MRKNGARRLTATCASKSSGVVSTSDPRLVSPAAFTRQSIRPNRRTTASTEPRACATSATSAATNNASRPPRSDELGGEGPPDVLAASRDDDGRSFVDGGPGHGTAHPLRPAADEQDLVVQQTGGHDVVAAGGVAVEHSGEVLGRDARRERVRRQLGLRGRGHPAHRLVAGRGWSGTGSPPRRRPARGRARRPASPPPSAPAARGRRPGARGRGPPSPSPARTPRRPAAGWRPAGCRTRRWCRPRGTAPG